MRYYVLGFILCSWLLGACHSEHSAQSSPVFQDFHLPADTTQALVVSSADWSANSGQLQRYQKQAQHWLAIGSPIQVRLGRNGMGWGLGLNQVVSAAPQKLEGDGRTPAGIFQLGASFGYAQHAPLNMAWSYFVSTERDYYVDDVNSPVYNHWVKIPEHTMNNPRLFWASSEAMRRTDQQYENGLIIEHNTYPPIKGRGSAIFMHVWLNATTPTSGCTAMAKRDLLTVLRWLAPSAKPVLIQAPQSALTQLTLPVRN
jgi:L,D-peptidoglycan transpeptidase YkuD (ErfK/YbiS/YcfS/YnhG family)